MAMALDPNLPYDDKRRIGMARAVGTGAGGGGGGGGWGDDNGPQDSALAKAAGAVVDFAVDPGGVVARANEKRAIASGPPVALAGQEQAPAAAAPERGYATPPNLPDGVNNTAVGGIYEGKRGYAGERVFSDNPYDRLLTDRSGGMVRRSANDVTASNNILSRTQGFTDRSGQPVDTPINQADLRTVPRYNFSNAADPQANNAGSRSGTPMYSREWELANQRLPTAADIDPDGRLPSEQLNDALAAQVSANKQALAMSRVQRGVATGANSGAYPVTGGVPGVAPGVGGMPGGVSPLDYIKTVSGVQVAQAGEQREQRGQDIALQQKNEDRANNFYDASLKAIQEDQRYAGLSPAEQAKAAHIRAAIALEGANVDPTTTTRGRLGMTLAAQGLAEQTNSPYDSSTFVPPDQADLGRYNVRRASGLERIGQNYVAEGPTFAPDPKTGRMVEVAPGTEGGKTNDSVRLGVSSRSAPNYLAVGTGGDLGSLTALIKRQHQKAAEYTAAEQKQGARRRYAY